MTTTIRNNSPRRLWPLILLFVLGVFRSASSQEAWRDVVLVHDSTLLDSFSIIPETFRLEGLDTNAYFLDAPRALLWLTASDALPITVRVQYRTFPFNFTQVYQHKSEDLILARQHVYNPFQSRGSSAESSDVLNLGDLEKSGSISRGITVGNNQNLSVNSSLNLQLSGMLNERFGMVAAIADQNIPIQPDGNTQQLQDFDQVYIQVFDEQNRITAGDFQISRGAQEGYFMQFNKRLQGARVESEFVHLANDSNQSLRVDASAAVSRGKFARKTIQGIEGNQGPYRLDGAEGESFVVVLSGTERVYLDGRLLTRGQEHDYVINYNTAEITFTAKIPITKDRRIVAEYQYSDRNYARSLLYSGASYSNQRTEIDLAFYSEQDAKNQPLQQELTDEQKVVLRAAGDSVHAAVASSVDSVGPDPGQLLYARIDTTYLDSALGVEKSAEDIFVFSTNPKSAVYQVTFSHVGQGNGDYVFDRQVAFGRIYRWVPPVDGQSRGTHAPVIKLVTPKQRQMVVAKANHQFSDAVKASIEWAGSNSDLNTFSPSDDQDDLGMGTRIVLDLEQPLIKKWTAIGRADYEYLHRNFQEIERFRSVEFDRDWNIRGLDIPENQHVIGAAMGARYGRRFKGLYGIRSFTAGDAFSGIQNSVDLTSDLDHLKGLYGASFTKQTGDLLNAQYYQHNTLVSVPIWKIQLGYKDDLEENKRYDPQSDTLSDLAYRWWEWEASLSNPDSAINRYKVSYAERTDWLKDRATMSRASFARIYGLEMGLNTMRRSKLLFRINYRTLDILNPKLTKQTPENTLLSRTEYQVKLLGGALTSQSFYEIGSGLENRKEFVYIETTPGLGTHIHVDYNQNGQKELDEFELAIQADQVASANFLKVFIPTSEYIKVFRNQFSQVFYLRPAAVWRSKSGIRQAISHFSDQFSFGADRKTLTLPLLDHFNPFLFDLADSVLQSTAANLRNILYFNQSHPVFGADLTYQRLEGRNLLTSGFESRYTEKTTLGIRWNFTSIFGMEARGEQGLKRSQSDAGVLSSRNYAVRYREAEPKLVLQPGTRWRLSLLFNYKEQANQPSAEGGSGGEKSFARRTGMEFTLSSPEKGSLFVTANLIQINYSGAPNSPVGFEMLEGLQPGLNATWGISYQRTLANNLQVNVNYNGRQSPGLNTIHTGGIEARAYF